MTNAKKGRVSSMRLKRFCEKGRCGIERCCRNDCKRRVEIRFGCLWIRWASMGKDSPLIFVSDRLWNRICDRWQGVEGACGEGDAGSVIERSPRRPASSSMSDLRMKKMRSFIRSISCRKTPVYGVTSSMRSWISIMLNNSGSLPSAMVRGETKAWYQR